MGWSRGQVVVITGCSTGIGRALVGAFAGAGHRVLATARRPDSLEGLAGDNVAIARLDVTSGPSIHEAVERCLQWAGRIDILVNNAGYALIGPVAELDLGDLRQQLETNVVGLVATTQAVVPHMADAGRGRIVNVGSVSGITAAPFGGAYSGSKAAVHLLSDALRMELAPFGIEVVTVQPGAVATEFSRNAMAGVERFREGSRFSPVYDAIEDRARFSEFRSLAVGDFARSVVEAVTRERLQSTMRLGSGSRLLPLLARLPGDVRDRIFSRRFGLERLP
jgi:NAD(P)-dependent dehydrogenase (short-subunit alcohol dehydrogenase family)